MDFNPNENAQSNKSSRRWYEIVAIFVATVSLLLIALSVMGMSETRDEIREIEEKILFEEKKRNCIAIAAGNPRLLTQFNIGPILEEYWWNVRLCESKPEIAYKSFLE